MSFFRLLFSGFVLTVFLAANAMVDLSDDAAAVNDHRQQEFRESKDARPAADDGSTVAVPTPALTGAGAGNLATEQRREREAAATRRLARVRALSANEYHAWREAGGTDAALDALESAGARDPAAAAARAQTQQPDPDGVPNAIIRRARLAAAIAVLLALILVWIVQRRQSRRTTNGQS